MKIFVLFALLCSLVFGHDQKVPKKKPNGPIRVLVYSNTAFYRHPELPAINRWLVLTGDRHGMEVDVTEHWKDLKPKSLAQYDVLLLNNANQLADVIPEAQRKAVEEWYRAGHGIFGLHAALVKQQGWPWLVEIGGCDFNSDSEFLKAKVIVDPAAKDHPAVAGQDTEFWYEADWTNHTESVTGKLGFQVLLRVDESSYEPVRDFFKTRGGKAMGKDHPIAWTNVSQGGRFFYTELGHDVRSLETDFGKQHIIEGIRWAAGREAPWEAEELIKKATESGDVPAMGVVKFDLKGIQRIAVAGTTRSDENHPVSKGAKWHIGSNTKAMTATLVGRLVERGLLKWDSTMAEIFPEIAKDFHEKSQALTIRQLLNHSAGLIPNPKFSDAQKTSLELVQLALKEEPGEKWSYSNWGYIIVGAAIEKIMGKTWEKTIEEEVFKPLGIRNFGFGAPGEPNDIRGHQNGSPAPQGLGGDNPPVFGPAGRVHLTLQDWVAFGQEQIAGMNGKGKLLKQETYRELFSPEKNDYALGWSVGLENNQPILLQHDGSNTFWYARIRIDLTKKSGVLVVANSGDGKAIQWVNDVERSTR